ncbi:Protein phosphatase 1E [Branchiostoma belcheri]|nr:Protein phosphatase 1E [Branchiostoma belcheri]
MASLAFSVYADKNGKNSMEDRHFMFKHRNGAFVAGVCDGHGGDFCSDFVARDLPENLSAEMDNHTDHETALRRAIRETDRELCSRLVGRWKKAGTTAVISLITGSEIITAWVGDSQAVLTRLDGFPIEVGLTLSFFCCASTVTCDCVPSAAASNAAAGVIYGTAFDPASCVPSDTAAGVFYDAAFDSASSVPSDTAACVFYDAAFDPASCAPSDTAACVFYDAAFDPASCVPSETAACVFYDAAFNPAS